MVISCFFAYGNNNEQVQVVTSNGLSGDPQVVGYVSPCSSQIFHASYTPSSQYYPYQVLWYVNGALVGSNNYDLQWQISTSTVSVYFKISYQYSDGHTEEVTSPTFNLLIKNLDFPQTISTLTSSPEYGCTEDVSFSLPEVICTGSFCGLTHNVYGANNITWQAPSGWTLSSSSNNGSNVTFSPDPYTDGDIVATIHYTPCDFQETRTLNITRAKKAPEFTNSIFQGCNGSSSQVSIIPVCGAASYSYSIIGNPGVTFSTNGLQTLTTVGTSVAVTLSGGTSDNIVSVKTNFGDNTSSSEVQKHLVVYSGTPTISGSYITNGQTHFLQYSPANNSVCLYAMDTTLMSVNNASSAVWTRIYSFPGNVDFNQVGDNINFYLWSLNQTATFRITASNPCISISNDFKFQAINCSDDGGGGDGCFQYQITPNPANSYLNIVVPNIPAPCDATQLNSNNSNSTEKYITEIKVWDNIGNLREVFNGNRTRSQRIDISALKKGIYFIEIFNQKRSEKHQVILQ